MRIEIDGEHQTLISLSECPLQWWFRSVHAGSAGIVCMRLNDRHILFARKGEVWLGNIEDYAAEVRQYLLLPEGFEVSFANAEQK